MTPEEIRPSNTLDYARPTVRPQSDSLAYVFNSLTLFGWAVILLFIVANDDGYARLFAGLVSMALCGVQLVVMLVTFALRPRLWPLAASSLGLNCLNFLLVFILPWRGGC